MPRALLATLPLVAVTRKGSHAACNVKKEITIIIIKKTVEMKWEKRHCAAGGKGDWRVTNGLVTV